ncbi:hypothetical protein GCM10011513_35760 [Franconibacter daqui]|nr:hypothetical protein GCM10011513_35760 [Franconibacter daqui]
MNISHVPATALFRAADINAPLRPKKYTNPVIDKRDDMIAKILARKNLLYSFNPLSTPKNILLIIFNGSTHNATIISQ